MNIADRFQLKPKDINHTYEHSLEFSIDDNIICLVTKLSSTKLAGYYILLVQLTVQADSNIYNKMGGSQARSNQSLSSPSRFHAPVAAALPPALLLTSTAPLLTSRGRAHRTAGLLRGAADRAALLKPRATTLEVIWEHRGAGRHRTFREG